MVQPEKTEMLLFLVSNFDTFILCLTIPPSHFFTSFISLSFPPLSSLLHITFLLVLSFSLPLFPLPSSFLLLFSLFFLFYPCISPFPSSFVSPSYFSLHLISSPSLSSFLPLPPTQAEQYMLNFEATHCVALPRDFLRVPVTGNL